MLEYYPKSFQISLGGILGKFDHKNAGGFQLDSEEPRNLTKMITFYILSMGMGVDYYNARNIMEYFLKFMWH